MPRRAILPRVGTAIVMGPRRQALVVEAAAALLAASLLTATQPFATIGRRLGTFMPPTDPRIAERAATRRPGDAATARRIGWAIRTAAPLMPFRSACLQQAVAAHGMLARRGIASIVHFGGRTGAPAPAETHAWLDAAGVAVCGYPIGADMVEIGCFG
jgi:hypothetical protein